MDIQRHSSVLGDTVEKLSDEASYKQLFHAYRDEEALPSGEVLKEIIDLCRAILFPGYYGNARISKQTIRFHTGVNVEFFYNPVHSIQLIVQANNVLNRAYQSHLSRLKYFEYYSQTPNNRSGIYNMGRN